MRTESNRLVLHLFVSLDSGFPLHQDHCVLRMLLLKSTAAREAREAREDLARNRSADSKSGDGFVCWRCADRWIGDD